jgi:antitoxin VapB
MALSIKNSIVEEKARELAQRSGKSITDALNDSLDLALQRQRALQQLTKKEELFAKVKEIQKRVAALPVLDNRTDDEILGYNEYGHFD